MPRRVYVLELGALVNAFGNGVVLPFLLIYLHNVRGISFGLAGSAAAVQSAAALGSGFLGGTLSDRIGPKRVLLGSLAVMTVAFALMPTIRTAWQAFAIYTVWGIGSGAFWPSQSALLAGLAPASRRAPAYALQRLAMNVGVALGGVTAGVIASVGDPDSFIDYANGTSRGFLTTQHTISNHSCDLQGDDAYCETYFLYVGTLPQPPHFMSSGRYVDHFQKRGGEWRIANRVTIVDATYGLPETLVGKNLPPAYGPGEVYPATRDRNDVSYHRPPVPRQPTG